MLFIKQKRKLKIKNNIGNQYVCQLQENIFQISLLENLQFDFIIIMGCFPQNRVQKIPQINVKPTKIQSYRTLQPPKGKSHNNQNIDSNFLSPKFPSYETLKLKKQTEAQQTTKKQQKSIPKALYNNRHSLKQQRYRQVKVSVTPPLEYNPNRRQRQSGQTKQLSNLQSIDNLSIVSKIQQMKSKAYTKKQSQKKSPKESSKAQEVNITFGNNLFGISSSKNSKQAKSTYNKQKQLILLNQLRFMNNQNVKKINIEVRNFNS